MASGVNRIVRMILRFPYATSLLPSSLLSRGIRSPKAIWKLWLALAVVLYGRDRQTRRALQNYSKQRRNGGVAVFQGQMLQDAWIDSLGLTSRYFLDVGAAYPIKYSNTYGLQERSWSGLLVEPNPALLGELGTRRSHSVQLAPVAIALTTGHQNLVDYGPLSSLESSASRDIYARLRARKIETGQVAVVQTLTFSDLLSSYSVPASIGYLSIDVEGVDFDILRAFPFSKYSVAAITIEHNLDLELRCEIRDYLANLGYTRVCRRWSSIDSWFVKSEFLV